ncbi:MAG: type IV pilus modification protein PilV [Nitrospirota bacterium]
MNGMSGTESTATPPHRRGATAGFTLIEVLITIFVLTVGLLGLAALQAQALRASGSGGAQTTANALLRNVADRILYNAGNINAYSGMDTSSGARPNCPVLIPAAVCQQDFTNWQSSVAALPSGRLTIAVVAGATFNTAVATVTWQDRMGGHTVTIPIQVAQ